MNYMDSVNVIGPDGIITVNGETRETNFSTPAGWDILIWRNGSGFLQAATGERISDIKGPDDFEKYARPYLSLWEGTRRDPDPRLT